MDTLPEENAGRTVQLGDDDPFGTVDDKGSLVGHVGNGSQVDILHYRIEILMFRVGTVKLQLGLQGHTESKSPFNAFVDAVTRGINLVIYELENKIVACVGNREILLENLEKAFVFPVLGGGVQLKKFPE